MADDEPAAVHEVDDDTAVLITSWADAKAMARTASTEESNLRERVLEALLTADGILPGQEAAGDRHTLHVYSESGRLLLQLQVVPTERVDSKALRRHYSSIADQFTVSSSATRLSTP